MKPTEPNPPVPTPPAAGGAPAPVPPAPPSLGIEDVVAFILRAGVLAALVVVVAGTLLTFLRHPEYLRAPEALGPLVTPGAAFPGVAAVFSGVARLDGPSVVSLGLFLLIATPILRVVMSLVAFARERDRAFVVLTATVLALLALSFAIGRAGG